MAKVCLYHGSDLDGICSAAIVKHKYPDVLLYPVEYGYTDSKVDDLVSPEDEVIMVDYSLQPFIDMVSLSSKVNLTWIDHHDTAIDDYEKIKGLKLKGIRDVDNAACELTWKFLYPDKKMPYSIWLLGRYDIWRHHESVSILPFQYGMKLNYHQPEDVEWWDMVFTNHRDGSFIQDIIQDGKTIIRYRNKLNEKLCEVQAFESKILNYKCICINRALCGSTVFDSIDNIDDYDIMAAFYICKKGAWNVSLYTNKENVNVGKIAKMFGGGGHKGAAGFRCSLLPFEIT